MVKNVVIANVLVGGGTQSDIWLSHKNEIFIFIFFQLEDSYELTSAAPEAADLPAAVRQAVNAVNSCSSQQ